MKPRTETKAGVAGRGAGGDGKRWVGKRAFPTLSGQEVGKRTGFSHFETALTRLFPHNSTQVVDFPRMYDVRFFWEEGFHRRDAESEETGTNQAGLEVLPDGHRGE